MNKPSLLTCTALLGAAVIMMPNSARAATDDDKKSLAMAAQSDQNEIALSHLANSKSTNPTVKAFAEKMVTEHTNNDR